MNAAREAATKAAVKYLSMFAGKTDSVKSLEQQLSAMTDGEFDAYMSALASGQEVLPYVVPNLGKDRISVERNLEIAEKIGHPFFERLRLTDPATGQVYLTPNKYLVVDLPLKRLQQHLQKKIKIPGDNSHIDDRTGQSVGHSKGSSLSFPELQVLYSQGLESTIRELFKFRGGDEEAYKALNRHALSSGTPSMDAVDTGDTRVRSTEVLSIYLKAAHLDNNL